MPNHCNFNFNLQQQLPLIALQEDRCLVYFEILESSSNEIYPNLGTPL